MKRMSASYYLSPAGVLRPGLLACLMVLAPLLAARSDQHWTTNGVHQGILTSAARADSPNALDDASVSGGRNYIGRFTLSYAVWSLAKEPVHDYIFTWDWHPGELAVGSGPAGAITTRGLAKYPDLARQFSALKPISVTLATDIEFYDAKNERIGKGRKTIIPDLVESAGSKEPLHVPGSPKWEDFFQCENGENLSSDDRAAKNQKLFSEAVRVQIVSPKLTAIEWPEGSLKLIAAEFTRREAMEKKSQATVAAKPSKAVKPGTSLNPLELAAAGKAPLNPLERAARADSQSAPANPLELASQGVRTAPENPLEKTVRLEAQERARQEAIRREQERQAEVAQSERAQKEMAERAEAQRRRDYQDALAASQRSYEDAAADRAYRRAYNQQNREKAAWEAGRSRESFKSFMDPALFGNNSAPSLDPRSVVGQVPSRGRGNDSARQAGQGSAGYQNTSPAESTCPVCNGSRRVLTARGRTQYQAYQAELEANRGKGTAVPAPSCEDQLCPSCGGTGRR